MRLFSAAFFVGAILVLELAGPARAQDGTNAVDLARRQEEMDLRRLQQAEELLHRVRSASSKSRSELLHRRYEQMQENLLRLRGLVNLAAIRSPDDPTPKISPQVRPLLDETIQQGGAALSLYDAERRIGRDLDQTQGRLQRARKMVEGTTSAEVRSLLDRADDQIRLSQEASTRGDFVQARILMTSAERSLNLAIDLERRDSESKAADAARGSPPASAAGGQPTGSAEARVGLQKMDTSLAAASRRLGQTDDAITARLLVVAESNLTRARELYRQGKSGDCLRSLKLVGRLLETAYDREAPR